MANQIHCAGCNRYLGEIRDAKLLKGIKYLCPACETKRLASDLANRTGGGGLDFLEKMFKEGL